MTRPVLVLCTGSRALAGHAEARAWLRSRLDALGPSVVVTGTLPKRDRDGAWLPATWPDEWAAEYAREHDLAARVVTLDGLVMSATGMQIGRWAEAVPTRGSPGWRSWPLTRNRAEVQLSRARTGMTSVCLALHAAWATTHGTAFTADAARAAGLPVESRTWLRDGSWV